MEPPAPRPRAAADVVVIGAGVIGASCAMHLARAGLRVTVVDRGGGPPTVWAYFCAGGQ